MVAEGPSPVQDPNDDQATPLSGARNALTEGDNAAMSRHPHTSTTGLAAAGLLALSAACVPAGARAQSDALQIYARLNLGLESMGRNADGARHRDDMRARRRHLLG